MRKNSVRVILCLALAIVFMASSAVSTFASTKAMVVSTGFYPQTTTMYPILKSTDGLTYDMKSLTYTTSVTADSSFTTFGGPGYDYLDKVKAAAEERDAALVGWHIATTGNVRTNSSRPDLIQNLNYSWLGGPTKSFHVSAGERATIEIDYPVPEDAASNVYMLKVTGNLTYYEYKVPGGGYDYTKLQKRDWEYKVTVKPLKK